MAKKKSSTGKVNESAIRDIAALESIWQQKIETYKSSEVNEKVSILLRCKSVAHRFALIAQLAGHYLDAERNLFALQKKSEVHGAWDPRSFCKKVIVPWLRNHKSPLGSSAEPYVSNPLRQKLIVREPEGVKKSELPLWADLHQVLTEAAEDQKTATKLLHQSICILMRMIDEQDLPLKVPNRVSAASVCFVVQQFLSEGSGGDRAVAVSTAIFSVLLAPLLDIDRVERAAVNAADASTQLLADICCYDAKNGLVLAIEVKERTLTFEDVRSAIEKISKSPVGKFVFAAPLIEKVDASKIRGITDEHFRKEKRAFHHVTVEGLLATSLMMNEEPAHADFIREVDAMLTSYNTQPENRRVWRDLVSDNC